jgi:hypothetical protein
MQLDHLPPELLAQIAGHLTAKDYANFKATKRATASSLTVKLNSAHPVLRFFEVPVRLYPTMQSFHPKNITVLDGTPLHNLPSVELAEEGAQTDVLHDKTVIAEVATLKKLKDQTANEVAYTIKMRTGNAVKVTCFTNNGVETVDCAVTILPE